MPKILLMLSAVVMLSGCTSLVESDTWVNQAGRVQINEDQFTDTFETAKLNDGTYHAIADYYDRYANGPMNIVVSYDPKSRVNTRGRAEAASSVVQQKLMRRGVHDINGTLSVMPGSGDSSTTLVSFSALTADAPAGCGMMPGYKDPSEDIPNDTNIKPPYGYGCTIETLLAKQVVKPGDLMGRAGYETGADGRRAERVMAQGYYSDKPNQPLQGSESATEGN